MIRSDDLISIGLLTHLQTDGEVVTVCDKKVVAIVNRSPHELMMMDSGYSEKEPITIEVQKGYAASLASVLVRGVNHPADLRGATPQNNKFAYIDNVKRKIQAVQDQGSAWLIVTVKLNSNQPRANE